MNPRDALALKVAQDLYFFLGSRLDLRDVAARVLRSWPEGQPGWGYVQGIYAFGLEENADYRQAENRATVALTDNPRDVWSVHALAHVYEMEGRQREGSAFLSATSPDWQRSYFAVHNWWHRALTSTRRDRRGPRLYDRSIRARRSTEGWTSSTPPPCSGAWPVRRGRHRPGRRAGRGHRAADGYRPGLHLQRLARGDGVRPAADQRADLVMAANIVTAPTNRAAAARPALLAGFRAYAAGHPEQAIDRLIDIRQTANAVGGSHAQRDVIDLTLIAAAVRAGDEGLVRALADERTARKPTAANATQQLIAANTS
jgi:hypothetical protein